MAGEVETWGQQESASDPKYKLADLGPYGLEKELNYWTKRVAEEDKKAKEADKFSLQHAQALKFRDGAIAMVLKVRAVLVNISQNYKPLPGYEMSKVGVKEKKIADKYASANLDNTVAVATSYESQSVDAPLQQYRENPVTQTILPSVKSKSWMSGQQAVVKPATTSGGGGTVKTTQPLATTTTSGGANNVMGPVVGRPSISSARETTGKGKKPGAGAGTGTGGSAGGGTDGGKGSKETNVLPSDWENVVRKKFPAFAYLLDGQDFFGPEVVAVLKQAIQERWYENPDGGQAKFDAAIKGTPYWKNTESDALNFDALTDAEKNARIEDKKSQIRQLVGDTQLPQEAFDAFARDMTRRNISDKMLQQMAYAEVFKVRNEGGYQYFPAATKALKSGEAEKLKTLAKDYFSSVSDADIQQYLTGTKSLDDFETFYREKAKGMYGHLASQLDTGLTLAQIASDYKSYAAQILEKPESEIDMMKPEFLEALSTRDDKGNTRQLGMGEWINKLRTEDRYGYKYTMTAKNEAMNIAYNLAQAFGGVK